jgi:hypothetical protein
MLETCAKRTIPTPKPNEERPTPLLQHLEVGWIEVAQGYVALVVLLLPEDFAETVQIQVRRNFKEDSSVTQHRRVMLFEGAYFRTEPAGVHYAFLLVPTCPLGL